MTHFRVVLCGLLSLCLFCSNRDLCQWFHCAELAGWLQGRGPELLLRYHVRVARVTVVHWALGLHRPPTASPVELGTGVLWVSTGTHPCGPSGRVVKEPERQPYVHWTTCYDYRGDVDYRRVFLQTKI